MEANMNHEQYQDVIDFREIFLALWKHKFIIICVTFIAALIAGIYSLFILSPVYHSKMNIVINNPKIYNTQYGDYILPFTMNQQYINLITSNDLLANVIDDMGYDKGQVSIESLRNRIVVDIDKNYKQNNFGVSVAADNPEEAKKLADVLYKNFIEFLDVMTAEGALNYYTSSFSVSLDTLEDALDSNQKILKKNEELLAQTPQTYYQKEASQGLDSLTNVSNMEPIINENYTKIESDIISNKQTINDIENSIRIKRNYLKELDAIKAKLDQYYQTGDFNDLKGSIISFTDTNVYLPSAPIVPSQKTSPSNARNVIIGTFIGGVLSVLVVLVKEYWFKKEV